MAEGRHSGQPSNVARPAERGTGTPAALRLPAADAAGPAEGDTPRFSRRFAWFVAIWGMSVAVMLAISALLRFWLVP